MSEISVHFADQYAHLDDASRALFAKVVRLCVDGVPHRIVMRLDVVNGVIGAFFTTERRGDGRWNPSRAPTWLPFSESTNAVFAMLLHVGEHGRLPDPRRANNVSR